MVIFGETGTGKELLARSIHQLSGRKGPFLASPALVHDGKAGSKLPTREHRFLTKLRILPPPLQVKLLRVLQEREIVRVGSRRAIPADIRLIVATNVDLNDAVAAGRFRLDLLYRINLLEVRVPPLRYRPGDILPLAQYFLAAYSKKLNLPERVFTAGACEALQQCWWSGTSANSKT